MKSFIWLATFLLIPLGCTTTNQELNVNKDYVVQVISLKGERHRMEKLFKCPNGCKKICSNVDFNSGFSACLEQTDVAVTRYPLVYLNLGENQVIDQLVTRTFPADYDESGQVSEFATQEIGKKISLSLFRGDDTGRGIRGNISLKNHEFLGWDTSFSDETSDYRIPKLSLCTIEVPGIGLIPSTWVQLSSTEADAQELIDNGPSDKEIINSSKSDPSLIEIVAVRMSYAKKQSIKPGLEKSAPPTTSP